MTLSHKCSDCVSSCSEGLRELAEDSPDTIIKAQMTSQPKRISATGLSQGCELRVASLELGLQMEQELRRMFRSLLWGCPPTDLLVLNSDSSRTFENRSDWAGKKVERSVLGRGALSPRRCRPGHVASCSRASSLVGRGMPRSQTEPALCLLDGSFPSLATKFPAQSMSLGYLLLQRHGIQSILPRA